MHQLPLLTQRQYVAAVHTRLQESQPWKQPGLQATVRLAWALALRGISQLSDVTGKLDSECALNTSNSVPFVFLPCNEGGRSSMHIPLFKIHLCIRTLKFIIVGIN